MGFFGKPASVLLHENVVFRESEKKFRRKTLDKDGV